MTDLAFDSQTSRFQLPLLFAGQAQKELFVNEIACRIDCLLHPVIEGTSSNPPADANDGQAWIVGQSAEGLWAGKDHSLACRQSGNWHFFRPVPGMRAFDKIAGRELVFQGSWIALDTPELPSGGTTVDVQARVAIEEIVDSLRSYGIFSPSSRFGG